MTTTNEVLTEAGARQALHELDQAQQLAQASIDENPLPAAANADQVVLQAADDSRVQVLRNRAKRQRDKGVQGLARRHDGVASLIRTIELQERVVGSAFERFYAGIEHGIHFISKLGGFFIGDDNADKLLDQIVDRIKAMEARVQAEAGQIVVALEAHKGNADWIVPQYTNPAAKHVVQIRTPLANRVATVFVSQDRFLQQLNQLVWNGEAEGDAVEMSEYQIKQELRGLAVFIARTLRGIQTKTEAKKAPAAPAVQQAADTQPAEALAA
jgi:hypothetical protein